MTGGAAWIRNLTLRRYTKNDVVLTCGKLSVDTKARPVSQEERMEPVWDNSVDRFCNSIRVHISALHKKLRRALGYDPCEDEIELEPMIEEIYTDLAPVAEEKEVSLKCEGNARMIGSDTLVYRMLFNLTENAIRYNRPDGAVTISICKDEKFIQIRVADTGFGIPEQYRESIFQPFFRVDKSRSREHGGVGLGLSLVWEIAALHGGAVTVEESSGAGTVVLVTLRG